MPPAAQYIACIYCHKTSGRRKGTYPLSGGKRKQVWQCNECGRTWSTDIPDEPEE